MKHLLDFEKPYIDLQRQLDELRGQPQETDVALDFDDEIRQLEEKIEAKKRELYSNLSAWQRVQLARHPQRPYSLDYINKTFNGFSELHGDRLFHDDHAIVAGFAMLGERRVMVVGTQKGLVEESDLIIPNMRGIMQARQKPLDVLAAESFESATSDVSFEKPAPKGQVKLVDVDELISLLESEAKVI